MTETDKMPKVYGIIPARYGSKRFPGKPLADILGKPMFWHVFSRASKCPDLSEVFLATDDHRIEAAARELEVPVVMTRDDHPSGTDRVLEAAEKIGASDHEIVVNIQGDEPVLNPAMLSDLIRPFLLSGSRVATLAQRISREESESPDRVNVVMSREGKGLYFSRSLIPYSRDGKDAVFYEHVGLFAFRMDMLREFVRMGPSPLEKTENLEMLRLIENDIPLHVEVTGHKSISVDWPDDLHAVQAVMQKEKLQEAAV
ncbi:MAG TPA: 3-deoxy-manno-octulosonate cytidylyltransferase [Thermodesulfobacteriaceae bacterium]|nr:3-deoxy-manno-octulosonate cytidylyltransferase [Thermodesulfobacteriaceae bacterium]